MRKLIALYLLSASLTCAAENTVQTERISRVVENFLIAQAATATGQVHVETGRIPESDRFATCQRWEAFLPKGARAWGQVSVGLRCTEGGNFAFYVGAWVHVTGDYLVANQAITSGNIVQASDIRVMQGDLTTQEGTLLYQADQVVGRTAKANIAEGRPLLASFFRPALVIKAGQTVGIVVEGSGFAVTNTGQAIGSAAIGESVKIRMQNGRIITGTVRSKDLVEIRN